jgi:hypothetical protein
MLLLVRDLLVFLDLGQQRAVLLQLLSQYQTDEALTATA